MDLRNSSVYAYIMQLPGNAVIAKNLLVGAGAYYFSIWLKLPLELGFGKLTQGLTYSGDFNIAVVEPLVGHLPRAVVAAAAGAAVYWLTESKRPVGWAIFPAVLYAVLGFFSYHFSRPPVALFRVVQIVGALFPALACVAGALWAKRQRTKSESTPD